MVDIEALSDNDQLETLAKAFAAGYLHKNPPTTAERLSFKRVNLGGMHFPLLKTPQKDLFTFCCSSTCKDDEVSKTLKLLYMNIVAHCIVKNHSRFPAKNLTIAYCIGHDQEHFTMMLADFKGIDQAHYQKIFNAYQKKYNPSQQRIPESGHLFQAAFRNAKATISHTSNQALAVNVKNLTLRHYDSLDSYHEEAKKNSQQLIEQYDAKFIKGKCKTQRGNTCGEWSVFNAFYYGLLKKNNALPSSHALRKLLTHLGEYTTEQRLEETNKILFPPERLNNNMTTPDVLNQKPSFWIKLCDASLVIATLTLVILALTGVSIAALGSIAALAYLISHVKNRLITQCINFEKQTFPRYPTHSFSAKAYRQGRRSQKSWLRYFKSYVSHDAQSNAYFLGRHDKQNEIKSSIRLRS